MVNSSPKFSLQYTTSSHDRVPHDGQQRKTSTKVAQQLCYAMVKLGRREQKSAAEASASLSAVVPADFGVGES